MDEKQKTVRVGILKRLKHFRARENLSVSRHLSTKPIPKDQKILGVYENAADSQQEAIIVTDKSIWIDQAGTISEIRYADIRAIRSSPENKRFADTLVLSLTDGSERAFRILGRDAESADVFSVQRFLIHAAHGK